MKTEVCLTSFVWAFCQFFPETAHCGKICTCGLLKVFEWRNITVSLSILFSRFFYSPATTTNILVMLHISPKHIMSQAIDSDHLLLNRTWMKLLAFLARSLKSLFIYLNTCLCQLFSPKSLWDVWLIFFV